MFRTYCLARRSIYSNRTVKYSNKAFSVKGMRTFDSAVTHQSVVRSISTIWHKILTVENIDESGLGKF